MTLRLVASISLLLLAATIPAALGAGDSGPAAEAQRLVFLLQYVGADYPGAVQNQEIVSEFEYREMVDFAAAAAEKLEDVRGAFPPATFGALEETLADLRRRIGERADPRIVRDLTDQVIAAVIEAFDLKPVPRQLPRVDRAAAIYEENCAACHGVRGDGDGPDAPGSDPPPAKFTDPERMKSTAPYVFYNAITFGILDTRMASWSEALTDQERWDLAFYLWTFVLPDRLPLEASPITVSLRDLAVRSAEDLVSQVLTQGTQAGVAIGREEAMQLIAARRARPLPVTDHEERLARVRQDLLESMSLLEGGEGESAADVVTAAYLDDFEPLEPEIDRRNPGVRQRFERGLIDFRKAIRGDDREEARRVARDLVATIDEAERLFGRGGESDGRGTMIFIAAFGLVLGGGMWVLLRRS